MWYRYSFSLKIFDSRVSDWTFLNPARLVEHAFPWSQGRFFRFHGWCTQLIITETREIAYDHMSECRSADSRDRRSRSPRRRRSYSRSRSPRRDRYRDSHRDYDRRDRGDRGDRGGRIPLANKIVAQLSALSSNPLQSWLCLFISS